MNLPHDWQSCERGNTWLTDGENHVAWFDLPCTDQRLEVSVTPGNYPGFFVTVLPPEKSSDEHLAAHIKERCSGWTVRRCNLEGVEWDQETRELQG
jgi:hypothetical protein